MAAVSVLLVIYIVAALVAVTSDDHLSKCLVSKWSPICDDATLSQQ